MFSPLLLSDGVELNPTEYVCKLRVPTLDTTGRTVNGLVVYDVVLNLPFVRKILLVVLAVWSG